MGGKRRSSSSSSSSSKSFFSKLFRFSGRQRRRVTEEEPRNRSRIWVSDEDRGWWVGEPDIDRKATEFITKFHETRFTDPEWQTVKA